jgi:hypothetical protein
MYAEECMGKEARDENPIDIIKCTLNKRGKKT